MEEKGWNSWFKGSVGTLAFFITLTVWLGALSWFTAADEEDPSTSYVALQLPEHVVNNAPITTSRRTAWVAWGRDQGAEIESPEYAEDVASSETITTNLGTREVCNDGWLSASVGAQGRCSWHGGTSGRIIEMTSTTKTQVLANLWACGDGDTVMLTFDKCTPFNSESWTAWPFDHDNFRRPFPMQIVKYSTS